MRVPRAPPASPHAEERRPPGRWELRRLACGRRAVAAGAGGAPAHQATRGRPRLKVLRWPRGGGPSRDRCSGQPGSQDEHGAPGTGAGAPGAASAAAGCLLETASGQDSAAALSGRGQQRGRSRRSSACAPGIPETWSLKLRQAPWRESLGQGQGEAGFRRKPGRQGDFCEGSLKSRGQGFSALRLQGRAPPYSSLGQGWKPPGNRTAPPAEGGCRAPSRLP